MKKNLLVILSQNNNSLLELNDQKGSLARADLSLLRDKTLAIDADILLRKVEASPKKSM